jgi:S1-C subfamily serine protease
VARPHVVVTAAHVVAGATGIKANGYTAQALVIDRRNDVAVLRVPRLAAPSLRLANPVYDDSVAILGYPENGPFDARPGRIGVTGAVILNGKVLRITSLSGLVRHGNSGGPAVDASGRVEATIFAARVGTRAGYGIPAATVRADLRKARGPISTGSC